MTQRILTLPLDRVEDVFALRQSGRVAAAVMGCEKSEQVRVATALSELGRETLLHGGGASVHLLVEADGTLRIEIVHFPRAAIRADSNGSGLAAARKLIGEIHVAESSDLPIVTLRVQQTRRRGTVRITPQRLRDAIRATTAPSPLEELRLENRDLIATLADVKEQQEQLARLNEELNETNRGVMAMYAQLASELEETNRGVVALYAELDDKSARLHEASQAKSRFLASVSHELRSPVNSILGLARLLLDRTGGDLSAEQEKQLNLISGSSAELLRLVNDLLDLAKAESGRLQPEMTDVDLAEIFAELRASLRPLVPPEVTLTFDLGDVPPVQTDRMLVTQVVRNLVVNALKFTARGSVRVSAIAAVNDMVELAVADTGIGIAAEHQPKIFEEFFQVRGPLQARHKGSGLGLPYARRVAQTLGGDIRVDSAPGRGSTFTVRLPIRREHTAGVPAAATGPALSRVFESILVIDDDEAFRVRMRGLLHGIAKEVREASGGIEGLCEMRRARPDVALVDLRMPDLSGADVLDQMTADVTLRDIPVVIVTAAELGKNTLRLEGTPTAMLSKIRIDRNMLQQAIAQVTGA